MVDRPRASSITGTIQRAAIACQSCRQRKCDAQTAPSDEGCGPCRRAGQECLLDPLSDRRRSVNRKFVDKLQQRIEMLEALSRRETEVQQVAQDNNDHATSPGRAAIVSRGQSKARSSSPLDAIPLNNNNSDVLAPSDTIWHSQPALPTSSSINRNAAHATSNGSPTFYGATSHPHVVSSSEEPRLTSSDEIDAVHIDLDPASPHLRERLLQSYFKYQMLWVEVVNKESFLTYQGNGKPSRWYSGFLENAMLACGTRLSTSKSVRSLGSKYYGWAKDEALSAMSEPTPANLQGFLLLSEYEVTQGNDRPGWMFCGVACRMLADLGLHEISSSMRDKETREPSNEGDLAYALLSACLVYEGVWTLYLGRPSSIPRSFMNIVASRCREGRKADSPWLNAWVGLCVPMAEIGDVLNEHAISYSERSSALRRLAEQMEEWYQRLPPELTYNEDRLISMDLPGYGLHAQYCKLQILLRQALARPQNFRKRPHSQMVGNENDPIRLDDTCAIAVQHALRIARLVVTYREAFGMENIPSIMLDNAVVAATTIIEHLNNNLVGAQQEMTWLRQLVKSMESVQPHFPITGRMLDSLNQTRGSNPLCGIFPERQSNSTNGSAHDPPAQNCSRDLKNKAKETPGIAPPIESGPDVIWDSFVDVNMTTDIFSSGGFALDLLPTEVSIPNWPQSVS